MTPREVAATIASSAAKSLEQVEIAGADKAELARAIGANAAQVLAVRSDDPERLLRDLFDAALAARINVSVSEHEQPAAPNVLRAWAAELGLKVTETDLAVEVRHPEACRWIVVDVIPRVKGRAA